MDLRHSARFATRLAVQGAGDLYPGPVLMPRGVLRALDPLLALALGPGRGAGESLRAAVERTFRGRPDGPLLLATWSTLAAGEIPHDAVRKLLEVVATALPDRPADRTDWREAVEPRVTAFAACALPLLQPRGGDALESATRLGCALVLVYQLVHLPSSLAAGLQPLPQRDLASAGVNEEVLGQGLPTAEVRRLLAAEAAWAREEFAAGAGLEAFLGARLRRGVRAAVRRAAILLRQLEDPRRDPFRRPPALSPAQRWWCALRAVAP